MQGEQYFCFNWKYTWTLKILRAGRTSKVNYNVPVIKIAKEIKMIEAIGQVQNSESIFAQVQIAYNIVVIVIAPKTIFKRISSTQAQKFLKIASDLNHAS